MKGMKKCAESEFSVGGAERRRNASETFSDVDVQDDGLARWRVPPGGVAAVRTERARGDLGGGSRPLRSCEFQLEDLVSMPARKHLS